ncbi:hypothetical protein AVEN_108314-1 [Araneus ventricosus]|uniref:Uncharacterized protein n=1 Tax=Araneus ventricosus TaxID=182803 RepID=A0A4Y2WF84_ARAVE|nr:hypothetical protein AVEN_108314-1 [Araneus ventricosus]
MTYRFIVALVDLCRNLNQIFRRVGSLSVCLKRYLPSYLVYMNVRFEATRRLFWKKSRNFEPWSDDEDDTRASPIRASAPLCTVCKDFSKILINALVAVVFFVLLVGSLPLRLIML